MGQVRALDTDARYEVRGWEGVAVRIDGYPKLWEPYLYIDEDDEGNEIEVDFGEGEWIDNTEGGQIIVVMVGDDYRHTVDITDLSLLGELDYCAECGQVGCMHDGRDRS